ncbi:MAG: hypothetical protein ACQET7_04635 [Thermodesulfobacteriota bacterium]
MKRKMSAKATAMLDLQTRNRWSSRGAGLINFRSRLLGKSPASREIEQILKEWRDRD